MGREMVTMPRAELDELRRDLHDARTRACITCSDLLAERNKLRKALQEISAIGEREDADTDDLMRAVMLAGNALK